MPLTRKQKQEVIEDLKEKINRQKVMIFVAIDNLKAKEIFELREKLKEKDCLLCVIKKTLADRVFKESNVNCDVKEMKGQLALVFGFKDQLSAAKIPYKFSQENENLKILGGFLENNFIDPVKAVELAKIPEREKLLARLVQSIKSPLVNFTSSLQWNIKGLLYVLTKVKT